MSHHSDKLPDLNILWRDGCLTELDISDPLPHVEGSLKGSSEAFQVFLTCEFRREQINQGKQ